MDRDIDCIIGRLNVEYPGIQITQVQVRHPGADDDGLWFVRVPGRRGEIQLESSDGSFPVLIESDRSNERFSAETVEDLVSVLRRLGA